MTEETKELKQAEKMARLGEWYKSVQEAAAVKPIIENEQALRKEVMGLFFPTPVEGTNTVDLEGGWKLKGVHKLDRKVDEAALEAVMKKLREEYQYNADTLIKQEPKLDTKAYKALVTINPEAAKAFEEALTIKPGSPTLELIAPKESKPQEQAQ